MTETAKRRMIPSWVGPWLLIMAGMVLIMAVIGAITRLTESGLSITSWAPLSGALPPMNDAAWMTEFQAYQQSPQYIEVNAGMTLADFKSIFWWEWIHRQWGRLIGLVFAVPFLGLLATRKLPGRMAAWLGFVFLLGAAQGGMGWFMVASGLVDVPAVSHFRLAAHLLLAALLFCLLLLTALNLLRPHRQLFGDREARLMLKKAAGFGVLLVLATLCYGALVAGLDAGLIYNSFPDFDGQMLPSSWGQAPFLELILHDRGMIQLMHRMLAVFTIGYLLGVLAFALKKDIPATLRGLIIITIIMTLVQYTLGVVTLIFQVPLVTAVMHQAGAFVLLGMVLTLRHETRGA